MSRFNPLNFSVGNFLLPIRIDSHDEYDEKIRSELDRYVQYVSEKFKGSPAEEIFDRTREVVDHIKQAIQCERDCNTEEAKRHIKSIIDRYSSDPFFVCELDHSYAFRGVAYFPDLQIEGADYSEQKSRPLSFFRIRKGHYKKQEELQYIPKSRRSLCTSTRYSIPGFPCLYLAASSYCAWVEVDRPDAISISGYRPIDCGKKLRILNLVNTISLQTTLYVSRLIEGFNKERHMELYTSTITLFPLVMAVSVRVINASSDHVGYHPEYTISHLIMQCLKDCNLDGVAYLTARMGENIDFPRGVNLALPAFDDKQLCQSFEMTKPYIPQDWLTDMFGKFDRHLDKYLEEQPHYPMKQRE